MSELEGRYPKSVVHGEVELVLRQMSPDDEAAVAAFADSLPRHDLLFLRRDITQAKVRSAWLEQLRAGEITSLVVMHGDQVVGCSAVVTDDHSWSPHVGELRVLLAPDFRSQGLGRQLIQESFLLALARGLEKLTAQMTVDQEGAIAVFQDMGFTPEALLKSHVRDAEGYTHDLVVLSHDVAQSQALMTQYGLDEAFDT